MYELVYWHTGMYAALVDPDGLVLASAKSRSEGKRLRQLRDALNQARCG